MNQAPNSPLVKTAHPLHGNVSALDTVLIFLFLPVTYTRFATEMGDSLAGLAMSKVTRGRLPSGAPAQHACRNKKGYQ